MTRIGVGVMADAEAPGAAVVHGPTAAFANSKEIIMHVRVPPTRPLLDRVAEAAVRELHRPTAAAIAAEAAAKVAQPAPLLGRANLILKSRSSL